MTCFLKRRQLTAAVAAVGAAVMSAQMAFAQLDYSSSLAAEFTATFPGGDPSAGAPSSPTFGDWALRGEDGTSASLQALAGGLPASGQPGWDANPTLGARYTYFATQWQPGVTISPRIAGHFQHDVLWTAPASVNAGGVELSGSFEQLFEPARVLRISVYKNSDPTPVFFVDAKPPIVNGVILQRVDFGPVTIPVAPGDTLKFFGDGSGAGGTGVVTFGAWDARLTEVVIPEPGSAGLLVTGLLAWVARRRRRQ